MAPPLPAPPAPPPWDPRAQQLWEQGERQAAIDQLLSQINLAPEAVPRGLGLQLAYYVFLLGDLPAAEQFLRRLLVMHPDDAEILENLAVLVSQQPDRNGDAIPLFQRATELRPDSANGWDGLAKVLATAGDFAAAQRAGERSQQLKAEAAAPLPGWSPPAEGVDRFLQRAPAPDGPAQRVDCLSFSIWGGHPRYLRGALRNALLIPELYPGWRARFYLDDTVPVDFAALLRSLGADVRLMPSGQPLRQRLCWRFLVANDPGVGRFLVRDCDSVVGVREVAAVRQWLASGQWFHVMRDWWTHTDPILAGMWGGVAGVLPDLEALIATYQPQARETANVDQWFLRDVLWGSIRPHALIHDRCYRTAGRQPWPDPDPAGQGHVGQNEFAVAQGQQARWLGPWIRRLPCLQIAGEPLPDPEIVGDWEALVLQAGEPRADEAAPPPMPDGVTGRILNLKRSQARWRAMEARIADLGWLNTHQRYDAVAGSLDEARRLGLRNGGELGLWRSTCQLLGTWLASDPAPDALLHVLEDDAIPHPQLPLALEALRRSDSPLDVLFTEAFLTPDLYRRFRSLERQRQASGAPWLLLNGGLYLACASSYVLSRTGAQRLLEAMEQLEASGRLLVLDMALRQWIREQRLRAAITLPFFSTIAPERHSALQGDREEAVQRSQRADLSLRRMLFHQSWDPAACGSVLQELGAVLAESLPPEQQESALLELLATGRVEGWLPRY